MVQSIVMQHSDPRGSLWYRWDPHVHAPGTLLNDQFNDDWPGFLEALESRIPSVRAVGITDYFCIATYREAVTWKKQGRLAEVELLFPNVELRLDLKTERKGAVNLHLLFSPDGSGHEDEIERALSHLCFEYKSRQYRCTPLDLGSLGRAYDGTISDDRAAIRAGANQFKVDLQQLRDLFRREKWLRTNCLVAVAAGADGTSGLSASSFDALRQEIEAFVDIVFSALPSDRDFWLGKKPGFGRQTIEDTFGALKPCLHGSDAHDVSRAASPDGQRYCWIKGDLTFEAIRQAVIEPEERVWIGATPPSAASCSRVIDMVRTRETPWLPSAPVQLNPGLVSVIGARGSGKTALLDIIATGAAAIGENPGDSSFLKRASTPVDLIRSGEVELVWGDGTVDKARLRLGSQKGDAFASQPAVCYLSQQFVERLCSSEGLANELRKELERVIFDATDPSERLETDSFEDLVSVLLEPVLERRTELREHVRFASGAIVHEESQKERLPQLRKDAESARQSIERARKDLEALLPKGREERTRRLSELEQACSTLEAKVEALRRRKKRVEDLRNEVTHVRSVIEPTRLSEMRRRFVDAGIAEPDWKAFGMVFSGDVEGVLSAAQKKIDAATAEAEGGKAGVTDEQWTVQPLTSWPLKKLRAEREGVKKEVGIDTEKQRKYDDLQRTLSGQQNALRRIEGDIKTCEGADQRRKALVDERRANYARVFDTFAEEERTLRELYSPLRDRLVGSTGALQKLEFVVKRSVDVASWARAGEQLLDLRRETRFRGHGGIRTAAEEKLVEAWRSGAAEQVAAAMEVFLSESREDLLKAKPPAMGPQEGREWTQEVASWLYDTSHINVAYGIHYDSVAIEQLSPGTRGIVLLLLYLVIDRQDLRPLVVDQPEENLDPNSVFAELVPHFRDVRKRRQVIVVTHNANLVVNTDADQVIVASAKRSGDGLPKIRYECGSLENPSIRRAVCEILEGGERAFLEREKRYRLRLDESRAAR